MKNQKQGFTLIDTLVGVAVFLVVALSVYQGYASMFSFVNNARWRGTAALLADEQFEIMRNMPYANVGIPSGIPSGIVPRVQTLVRDGATFIATTSIRNVDDAFDGTIGGIPSDSAPADYKLAQIDIDCDNCRNFQPASFTARISPKNLENSSNNGALFIKAFDANGQPVVEANVHIVSTSTSPQITIDDVTGDDGSYQLVDVPRGTNAYAITVSKTGYSTDKTYYPVSPTLHPVKPNATVATGTVTQTSFAIDQVSSMNITTITDACTAVPSALFTLSGTKLIATTPNSLKYSQSLSTSAGAWTVNNLEWDTYNIALGDPTYDLEGVIPLMPFALAPNAVQDVKLILIPKNGNSLLVTVKDGASGLPITGATVNLGKSGATTTLMTGQGYLRQTDWSGGSGQTDFGASNKYFSSDGNVDVTTTAGSAKLKKTLGVYAADGTLTSSTFNVGTTSNFYQVSWLPQSQPPTSGTSAVRMQIAGNNDNTTWNFVGPDGTAGTYYTTANGNIAATSSNSQYIRYKLFLHTNDTSVTPTVSDIAITYSSLCTAPGQVFFSGLTTGTSTLNVSATGYQSYTAGVPVTTGWSSKSVGLSP